jgi:four helix bundle protein
VPEDGEGSVRWKERQRGERREERGGRREEGGGRREEGGGRREEEDRIGADDALVTLWLIVAAMRGHEDLMVWQRSMEFVAECYRLSTRFPRTEQFGLTNQLRRAAVSVPANIAEGNGRAYRKEYLHHLSIARGSLKEAETLLAISRMLAFAAPDDLETALDLADEVSRMLTTMRRKLS